MKKLTNLIFLMLFLVFSACQNQEEQLTFIVTTDVHGAFFPTDPISGETSNGSLAHVSQYLKTIDAGSSLVLLDNGDIIQGDPSAYYYNFESTDEEHLFTRIMHFMHYDAATVGNHDIEAGHPVYDRINQELHIPWLAANCIDTASGDPYFKPYALIKKGPLTIAVLGLITPRIPDWLPENIWAGMAFEDMVASAQKWIPRIIQEEKPDLMVGLFHSGMEYTYNNQDRSTPKNENAVQLVIEQVPGFDLVFCGHDHKTWNQYITDPDGDSVLVLGSESKAREIARADVVLTRDRGKWEITQLSGENISMYDVPPDPAFKAAFESSYQKIEEYVNQDVAYLETLLDSREAFFGPSAFMSLIHQVQLDITGADISFAAPLAFNKQIEPGMLKVDDLFDLYRFENLLYTMTLTGKQIQDYLNYSYSQWFSSLSEHSGHLLRMSAGQNGRYRTKTAYYNFDSCEGLDYEVDLNQPQGTMVNILGLSNGDLFNTEANYTVAINSYRGNGGGGLLTDGAGLNKDQLTEQLIHSTDKDLRFYMKQWMQQQKTIRITPVKNWSVVPEQQARDLKEKDYKLLFRN